jgi:hypothetical protein
MSSNGSTTIPSPRRSGVIGYPAFCLLDADGAAVASGYDAAGLPALAMV